jgi:hypothetical protein
MLTPSAVSSLQSRAPRFKPATQRTLFSSREPNRTRAASADRYIESNHRAAMLILESPAKYGGLMAEWARLVLKTAADGSDQ